MKGVNFQRIEEIHRDSRGEIYSYLLDKNSSSVMFVNRKKGEISGKHYHKGIEESKNPEKFIVVSGRLKAIFFDVKNEIIQERVIEQFELMEIEPFIYHEFEALSDTVFMEIKINDDNYNDVFRLSEKEREVFEKLKRER